MVKRALSFGVRKSPAGWIPRYGEYKAIVRAGRRSDLDRSALQRDDFSSNRHLALSFCLSMIFSENRYPLFRIMLLAGVVMLSLFGLAVGRLIDWLEARLLLWR
jgi:hypothetical protein